MNTGKRIAKRIFLMIIASFLFAWFVGMAYEGVNDNPAELFLESFIIFYPIGILFFLIPLLTHPLTLLYVIAFLSIPIVLSYVVVHVLNKFLTKILPGLAFITSGYVGFSIIGGILHFIFHVSMLIIFPSFQLLFKCC